MSRNSKFPLLPLELAPQLANTPIVDTSLSFLLVFRLSVQQLVTLSKLSIERASFYLLWIASQIYNSLWLINLSFSRYVDMT
jgi:hypothetical protein